MTRTKTQVAEKPEQPWGWNSCDWFSTGKALLDSITSTKDLTVFFFLPPSFRTCSTLAYLTWTAWKRLKRLLCLSRLELPALGTKWGTRPPSSVRLSSTGMNCWPANCMRATCSSRRLWIPTLRMESPTSTTLRCTMLLDTPWYASSGQVMPHFQGNNQSKCHAFFDCVRGTSGLFVEVVIAHSLVLRPFKQIA